ncbi:peptide ABC transporter ATP-binding protein [Skermanella stibiiresistens SB22]|uniref:Peptide ABC transporter ATP-binding protein n=1 Tax=Skermanella stibiiresistens SB22 TaxID=1385369 RepID=W9HCR0_9PROT|nr:ABC transporter ATP-binding protein [Skermanella stibiiresistens]EWY41653.1 peptide ABC transporter ATP-binding protein [Skermanella stibiiresistens SB22]
MTALPEYAAHPTPLLDAQRLSKLYPVKGSAKGTLLHAVDDVDLRIGAGECVGLVGESGCGKSTMVRLLARLIDPTSGQILMGGKDITGMTQAKFVASPDRGRIQVVFQDPTESLNPSFRVFQAIADPLRRLLRLSDADEIATRVNRAATLVGLPRELVQRYPHQLSGGQRARVGIARAIVVEPELLILDEPTSALDVSVQAVILRLLADLRARLGMSYLFVSHDLNVVRLLCSRVVVMYLGKVVEVGPVEQLFANPRHPYTQALIASIPDPARRREARPRLDGSPSSPISPDPNVCRFQSRCPRAAAECVTTMPALRDLGGGQSAACHFA